MANISAADKKAMFQKIYPVGSYYYSNTNNSPSSFVGGTWTQITGAFLHPSSSASSSSTGSGSQTYSLSSSQIYAHSHSNYHGHTGIWHTHSISNNGNGHTHSGSHSHSVSSSNISHTHAPNTYFNNAFTDWPNCDYGPNGGTSAQCFSMSYFRSNMWTTSACGSGSLPTGSANLSITNGGATSTSSGTGGSSSTNSASTGSGGGSGSSFNIMPPYRGCYCWRRDA